MEGRHGTDRHRRDPLSLPRYVKSMAGEDVAQAFVGPPQPRSRSLSVRDLSGAGRRLTQNKDASTTQRANRSVNAKRTIACLSCILLKSKKTALAALGKNSSEYRIMDVLYKSASAKAIWIAPWVGLPG
jgi:hypothetical protein